ncbi:MAG: hypothetical protein ACYTBZ_31555 [Planctomycetota bacterium]|jgi:hypothetical protein
MTRRVQLQVELTERQSEAKIRLAQPATSALLYGGAKGGGKSWFLCVWCYNYACELIGRFGLKPSGVDTSRDLHDKVWHGEGP